MDGAVRVRRAVVQNVLWRALTDLANALVEPHLLPSLQNFGLIQGQIRLHGKAGFGQINGGLQIGRHAYEFLQNS